MGYSVIIFVTRSSALSSEQFKDYYENQHIPLARSLVGACNWPIKFTRRYLARIYRQGFGGPANPDHPLLTLRGAMPDLDCDCVAELIFENEKIFQRFYAKLYEKDNAAKLAADESRFLEVRLTKAVVIGETITDENGVTTSETTLMTRSDMEDSDTSTSDMS
ncbi:hypothetical protein P153DRAFT_363424 [Dothidotthia symphoricarpi CBS 119687]|uniref:EthD domain-containing protein n=1 Tax=Dothidotthia symphoricarpi CBS 119687 TaxID=1392245 RepID=A0A6A6AMK8_9PLEO|nr:uncharacterized protein P153DRAFT_363424 [Dothidotthia symphoricarpi CBS 119687]KAF2133212.1 hypothetical protein P153DRAFT_363424 [Dothidotthia symphoricarpi CBS 119687]